jgi:hypothetical protein
MKRLLFLIPLLALAFHGYAQESSDLESYDHLIHQKKVLTIETDYEFEYSTSKATTTHTTHYRIVCIAQGDKRYWFFNTFLSYLNMEDVVEIYDRIANNDFDADPSKKTAQNTSFQKMFRTASGDYMISSSSNRDVKYELKDSNRLVTFFSGSKKEILEYIANVKANYQVALGSAN